MMATDHARDFLVPSLNEFKAEMLNEDPDEPICLHRSDIRHAKGPFHPLSDEDTRLRFDERILGIMRDTEYTVITVFLDKLGMDSKFHWERTHPYHFLMEVLMEKYALCLEKKNAIGDVMPEARGKPQDAALQKEFSRVLECGTRYMSAGRIRKQITSRKLKFRTKKDNIAGLQLCDLLAHPSHYAIRTNLKHPVELGGFANRVVKILLEAKYNRSAYGKVWGWGAKSLP